MNKHLIITGLTFLLWPITTSCFAQEKKLVNSLETSFELGLGGAIWGLQAKANHHWTETDRLTTMSGISFSSFWSSVNNYTQYFPELDALTDITGVSADNHLRVYSGVRWTLLNKKLILSSEIYLGAYHAYMNGNHYHDRLQINQDYSASQLFFDYGTRFGIGYQINDKIGIQATINNSFRQLGYGYRILPMLYQFNPDNKIGLGIGVVWSFADAEG